MAVPRDGAVLAMLCVAAIAGCSSSSDTTNVAVGESATINGSAFAATGSSFTLSGTTLSVAAFNLNYTITFSIAGITTTGTYPIGTQPVVIFIVSKPPSSGWDT